VAGRLAQNVSRQELCVMIKLLSQDSDDNDFIEIIKPIINGAVHLYSPNEFYLIKIDNWFGIKWLRFSHKVMGAFGVSNFDLVVPPFVPNRVVKEEKFIRSDVSNEYKLSETIPNIHRLQQSEDNAQRKIQDYYSNDGFIWWSGNSKTNGRGSLMAYLPTKEGHMPWYIECMKQLNWIILHQYGISNSKINDFIKQSANKTDAPDWE